MKTEDIEVGRLYYLPRDGYYWRCTKVVPTGLRNTLAAYGVLLDASGRVSDLNFNLGGQSIVPWSERSYALDAIEKGVGLYNTGPKEAAEECFLNALLVLRVMFRNHVRYAD